MGTHPIFESDFDCLTEFEMGKTKEEIESEESSSEEEEDDPIISAKSNEGFIKALNALRNNDKSIYDKETKFYESDDEDDSVTKVKKEKALTLKDYDRNVIEKKGGIVDEEAETMQVVGNIKSFAQEQDDLKNEFKKIGEDLEDSSDEELFTKKAIKPDSTPAAADGSDVDYSSGEELADRKYHKDETDVAKMFKRKLIEQVNADNGELKITPQTFADIPREEQRDSKSYPREGLISVRQNEKAEKRAEKRSKKKAEKELKVKQRKEEISRQKNEKIEDLKLKMEQLKEAIGMDIDLDPEMFEGDFEIDDVMPQIMAKIEQGDYDDTMKPEFNDDIEGFDFSDEEPVEKKPKKSKRGKRSKKGEIDESDLKTAE